MCSSAAETPDALDALAGALSAARDAGPTGDGGRIGRLLALRSRLDAALLAEVAAFDTAGGCAADGSTTTAGWLRARQRLGRRDASALVHQARELRDLTETAEAIWAGRISREHAVQIVKAKTSTDG